MDDPLRALTYFACVNRHKGCVTRHLARGVEWAEAKVSGMIRREDGGFMCRQCFEDMVDVGEAAKHSSAEASREPL